MKAVLVSFLTFAIGLAGAYVLQSERVLKRNESCPAGLIYESQTEDLTKASATDESLPFFGSFGEDEVFSGWLIADKFSGMKEVWTVLLSRDYENTGDVRWSAMVLTRNADGSANDDDGFASEQIETQDNRLSFRTNTIRGVRYELDGSFLQNGHEFSDEQKVLRGTMKKIVKGKQAASFTADFAYAEPQCFH